MERRRGGTGSSAKADSVDARVGVGSEIVSSIGESMSEEGNNSIEGSVKKGYEVENEIWTR